MPEPRIVPVILAGGGGTRLWPVSRPDLSKQFLALASERTMLQATAERIADRSRYGPPLIVANRAHANQIEEQLRGVACKPAMVLLEPAARNTAAAIALAALSVDPETLLLVMPSDHVIDRTDAFHEAVEVVVPFARDGWLVTFGITPTRPETGFGYIKLGEPLASRVHRVERFVEKPVRPSAEAMLSEGGYAWNGGIFLFQAGTMLEALRRLAPTIFETTKQSLELAQRSPMRVEPEENTFASIPSQSIDCAVMEKAERIAVVPVDLGWTDVGSWDSLYELGPCDAAGNVALGPVRLVDAIDCLACSDGPRVSVVGVSNLIIVATGDEVLIMPRGRSQEVKPLSGA